jgi:TPR repeat protein
MAGKASIVLAAALAGLMAQTPSAYAAAPATAAATDVSPVTVKGGKRTGPWVPQEDPVPVELRIHGSELCNVIYQDPISRAMYNAGAQPRVYDDTRYPRNPDWNAPPVTPKGSPYPAALSMRDYMATPARNDLLSAGMGGLRADAGGFDDSAAAALFGCLASAGGLAVAMGDRLGIKLRDRKLPVAFALFDHGRWEEALDEFKVAYRKLPDVHGGDEAALAIGKIYLYGLKDRSDPVAAVPWLKKAAGARFDSTRQTPRFYPAEPQRNTAMGEAAMILAQIYSTGRGAVAKDPAQARKFLERAFYLGHIPAATALGDIYYNGVDTPQDQKKAFSWYMKAAVFQHAPADVAVARMYATGEAEGGIDRIKALAWYVQAARLDNPEALYALATAFDQGEGVVADPALALALYKRAAIAGDPAAQAAIGTYFYQGDLGVPRDLAIARRWFERAAIGGDVDGMFNLAVMEAKGEGGGVDRVKAWGWLKIAEKLGHDSAGLAARALETQFTPEDQAGVTELKRTG